MGHTNYRECDESVTRTTSGNKLVRGGMNWAEELDYIGTCPTRDQCFKEHPERYPCRLEDNFPQGGSFMKCEHYSKYWESQK